MNLFQCRQCGACCRQPGFVYLKEGDAARLATHLGMDIYQFTETHCLLMDRQHLALKKHADETCLFLREESCSVYEARPAQCREFPLGWKTERSLNYCKGLKKA
ncbi:MAG: YkgJ family cysteine cluster protein [Candidatus Omnitrophica bacterium]|nr:YkgJ family cysteine cluster protein [Candidatus Omnitrophota bacterium]